MQGSCGLWASRVRFSAVLAALAAAAMVGCERTTRDTDIRLISVSEVKHLVDQRDRGNADTVILIDPRPRQYYDQARLPGARHLILPDVPPRGTTDPSVSRHSAIVVYGDDPASAIARGMTKRMMQVGYRGVRLFAGGVKEWTDRGYSTEGTGVPAEPAPVPKLTTPSPAPVATPAAEPAPVTTPQ